MDNQVAMPLATQVTETIDQDLPFANGLGLSLDGPLAGCTGIEITPITVVDTWRWGSGHRNVYGDGEGGMMFPLLTQATANARRQVYMYAAWPHQTGNSRTISLYDGARTSTARVLLAEVKIGGVKSTRGSATLMSAYGRNIGTVKIYPQGHGYVVLDNKGHSLFACADGGSAIKYFGTNKKLGNLKQKSNTFGEHGDYKLYTSYSITFPAEIAVDHKHLFLALLCLKATKALERTPPVLKSKKRETATLLLPATQTMERHTQLTSEIGVSPGDMLAECPGVKIYPKHGEEWWCCGSGNGLVYGDGNGGMVFPLVIQGATNVQRRVFIYAEWPRQAGKCRTISLYDSNIGITKELLAEIKINGFGTMCPSATIVAADERLMGIVKVYPIGNGLKVLDENGKTIFTHSAEGGTAIKHFDTNEEVGTLSSLSHHQSRYTYYTSYSVTFPVNMCIEHKHLLVAMLCLNATNALQKQNLNL